MKTRKIQVTTHQIHRLIKDLRALPDETLSDVVTTIIIPTEYKSRDEFNEDSVNVQAFEPGWKWESEDHTVTGNATLDRQDGSLSVHFVSTDLEIEGTRVVVTVNSESGEGILELLEPLKQLATKFTIPTGCKSLEDLLEMKFDVKLEPEE